MFDCIILRFSLGYYAVLTLGNTILHIPLAAQSVTQLKNVKKFYTETLNIHKNELQ